MSDEEIEAAPDQLVENRAVVVAHQASVPAMPSVTIEKLRVIRNALGTDLNENELALFAEVANRSGLDPFAKQIYAVRRKGRVSFQTGIDGYRSIAARTGEYDGQDEPAFGEWITGDKQFPWGHPESATVRVYRKGMGRGVAATAFWSEYAPTDERDQFMWRRMPRVMLAKVAEALALRKAFPYVYGGLYTDDEMTQANDTGGVQGPPQVGGDQAGNTSSPRLAPPTALPTTPVHPPAEGSRGFEGVVSQDPDGVRQVKVPEWSTVVTGDTADKVELVMKVGNRKHTAVVLGPLARPAADRVREGATLIVTGQYHEHVWQEGKPPKKEIRNVTALWVDGEEIRPAEMPLADPPKGTPHQPPTGGSAPTAGASEPPMPLEDEDVFEEGWAAFGDVAELPVLHGAQGEKFGQRCAVMSVEDDKTPKGNPFWRVWLRGTGDDGQLVRIEFLVGDSDAISAGVPEMSAGELVQATGVWASVRGETRVLGEKLVRA